MKFTIYCNFTYSRYPMDQQSCNINIGSASKSAIFVLQPAPCDQKCDYHVKNTYQSDNFNMKIEFFDNENREGKSTIGINIDMCRILYSYLFMYYIPCITIVLVSLVWFVIPISAIPGRVGLLVTQILTLTNLLIHQMVIL